MGGEGYDTVKKKFVASWIENMGTGIQFSDGTYDPATKTLTYTSEMEPVPGMKTPVREVIKVADNNHMTLEWYENHGGQEKKKREINYTPAGKKKREKEYAPKQKTATFLLQLAKHQTKSPCHRRWLDNKSA